MFVLLFYIVLYLQSQISRLQSATLKMDSVCNLKRDLPVSLELCFLCQIAKKEKTYTLGERGKLKIQDTIERRRKLRDHENRALIDRIDPMLAEETEQELVYHKSCYSTFTSTQHILRVEKPPASALAIPSKEASSSGPRLLLRSSFSSMNWDACMFCQDTSIKERLISITTLNKSDSILTASKYDPVMLARLSGVSDLMAAEGKYQNILDFLVKILK